MSAAGLAELGLAPPAPVAAVAAAADADMTDVEVAADQQQPKDLYTQVSRREEKGGEASPARRCQCVLPAPD